MNEKLRGILDGRIKAMLSSAKMASDIGHPGLIGKLREIFLNDLVAPLLNGRYSLGTGKITDYEGHLSNEIDLCIYSKSLHPPFFFSHNERTAIFPIESVLGCIEIKSKLTLREMRDAYEKFLFVERNLKFTPGMHDQYNRPLAHIFSKPEYSVFSYEINTSRYNPKNILDLYKKVDPEWNHSPLISSFCVANKGCLIHTTKGWLHMKYDQENNVNEEVIFYLCALVQGFPIKEESRHIPRIGYYLTNPSLTDRFENGTPVKKPWDNSVWVISNSTV